MVWIVDWPRRVGNIGLAMRVKASARTIGGVVVVCRKRGRGEAPFRDRDCGACDCRSHDQLVAPPRCKCDIKKGEKNSKAKASVGKSEHVSIVEGVIQMSPCATDIDAILKTKKNGGRMR
jgi:hypothetical protein